jgi:hypothetical protein
MAYYCIAIYCGQGSRKTGDPGVWKWAWHHGGVQSDGRPDRIPYVRYWRHLPPAPELPQKAEVSIKNSPKSLKFAPKSDENEKVDP